MDDGPVEAVIARIQGVYRGWRRDTPVAEMRQDWERLLAGPTVPHVIERFEAGDVPAAFIAAPGAEVDRTILYLHGGGFRLGSIASHRDLMARLSAAAGCRVLGLDYRLAPEHRFPAPLQDALAAWTWLEAEVGDAGRIALAGDSAGGGLALSLMTSLRDAGRALPSSCLLMSPWTDLAATGESYVTRAGRDPIHQRPMILAMANGYLGPDVDPRDPLASPLYADLSGLPPLLIQVGDRETVLDDSRRVAKEAAAAGVSAELDVADGMIHVYQLFADELPEARHTIAKAGAFLRRHLSDGTPVSASPRRPQPRSA